MESTKNLIDEELKKIKDFVNSDTITVTGLFLDSHRLIKTQGMSLIDLQIILQCICLAFFMIGKSLQLKWLFFLDGDYGVKSLHSTSSSDRRPRRYKQ